MQPLISVIVPVYKVELYLRQCVDSILAQTYQNLEIILVDDGSPDGCPAICDKYAEKDARVRVLHKENGGLSDARNAGIDIAKGDYIAFVDSDDWIMPDMYERLYSAAEKHHAEIVVCEYYDCWSNKYFGWHKQAERIFCGKEGMEALLGLKFGNYAWNKLYKRELWTPDIRYPVGRLYEDVRTTYKLVQKCETVVAIPEVKYYYRRHKQGITGSNQLGNMVQCVGSRMERFESIADKYPEQRTFMLKEIYERHLMALRGVVCAKGGKNCREDLKEISDFLLRHKNEMLRALGFGRLGKLSYHFLCLGTRRGYQLSAQIDRLYSFKQKLVKKTASSKLKAWIDKIKKYGKLSCYYKWYMKLPLKKAIFMESRAGNDLAGNMFRIAQAACGRNIKVYLSVKCAYLEKVNLILQTGNFPGLEIVVRKSRSYYKALGTSRYWFTDMCLDYDAVKRPEQIFVNTWHGTPLKKLEFDIENQRHSMGGGPRDHLKCSYLAVPSRFLFERILKAANVEPLFKGKALYCGYPRNSIFFDGKERQRVRQAQGIADREVFAYMPTWRGPSSAHIYEEYSLEKILDFFEANLNHHQVVFVNLHNFSKCAVDYEKYQKVRPFPDGVDAYSMLNAADCLITDYSSVFFDYANTRRKVVLFTYDRQEYLKDRGLYLELDELPFPKADTFDALAKELNTVKNYDDAEFIRTFCTYDCEDSAQRLLSAVVDGEPSCEMEEMPPNGRKNILIYDAMVTARLVDDGPARAVLGRLDPDAANYFYCYRQDILEKTPAYLREIPEGIRILTLTNNTICTLGEKIAAKVRGGGTIKALPKREKARQINDMAFDDIRILDENEYDPFCKVLKEIAKEAVQRAAGMK